MMKAAKCRVAVCSTTLREAMHTIAEAELHDQEALLHWDKSYWFNHSIIRTIHNIYLEVDPFPILEPIQYHIKPKVQQCIAKHLLKQTSNASIRHFLVTRISKWLPVEIGLPEATARMLKFVALGFKHLPAFVVLAFVRSLANAHCTATRFGNKHICRFGCSHPNGDRLSHLLVCPSLLPVVVRYFPHGSSSWPLQSTLHNALLLQADCDDTTVLTTMVWHDVIVQSHNALRNSSQASLSSLVKTRVRALCRQCPAIRAILIRQFRR